MSEPMLALMNNAAKIFAMTQQANKMAVEESQASESPAEETAAAALNELTEPGWSVITFETVAASNLTYDEAARLLAELRKQKISGLCVVTDEAAARFSE